MNQQLQSDNNIVFGTGPLGLSVMEELVSRGREVTLVNRHGVVDELLPDGVKIVRGDATNPDEVAAICAGADVVFQCAQPPMISGRRSSQRSCVVLSMVWGDPGHGW
ncbi:MAG: NAD(P)H-binding protein [Chloroflexota bacterium]